MMTGQTTHINFHNRRDVVFFVASICVMAWQCFVMALDTQLGGVGRLFGEWHVAAISVANALLLLSPYWLLPRRLRWLVWVPLTLITFWCLMHMCYCRAYDDLMPWRSLTLTANVNSTLVASTLSLLRWQDTLIVVPFVALVVLCLWNPQKQSQETPARSAFLLTMLGCAVFAAVGYVDGDTNYRKRYLHNFSNRAYFSRNGLIPYTLFSLREEFKIQSIDEGELLAVRHFLDNDCPHYDDNRFSSAPRRNLVLIIVESLHTWPIGMAIDGKEVTPVLNRLVTGDSVIYAPHVLFQTSHGHSSDAHLIYNTGLLPLRDGVAAVNHGDGPYPALSRALEGYDCREIICTPGVNWNQSVTSRTYGFDTLYTRTDLIADGCLKKHDNIDDAALVDFAARLLPSLRQPFFLEMVTMTMHAPYSEGKVPGSWITASDTLNTQARGYLNCVHVTDSCIGKFMSDLNRMGLARNTIVAIVSDHTQLYLNRVKGFSDYVAVPDDWGIPMIISGCDTTLRYEPILGQVDVFPTLLDVMGANHYWWKGLGHSILRFPVTSAIQPRNMTVIGDSSSITPHQLQAWDIGELLIYGRDSFFNHSQLGT